MKRKCYNEIIPITRTYTYVHTYEHVHICLILWFYDTILGKCCKRKTTTITTEKENVAQVPLPAAIKQCKQFR